MLLNNPAPDRIEKPIGDNKASSTVNVKVFSPSQAINLVLPLPPCAYTVVAAPSTVEVVAESMYNTGCPALNVDVPIVVSALALNTTLQISRTPNFIYFYPPLIFYKWMSCIQSSTSFKSCAPANLALIYISCPDFNVYLLCSSNN